MTTLAGSASASELDASRVAVVYNARSVASRTIAQTWMQLRGVDPTHAVALDGVSWHERTDLIDFRRRILAPVEATLRARGLDQRIALIAYAPDLPLNIWFTSPRAANGQRGPGAVTGLTLLAPQLERGWETFTAARANAYHERIPFAGDALDERAAADPRNRTAAERMAAKDLAGGAALYAELAAEIAAPSVLYNLACAQALLKQPADALRSLDRAVAAGWLNERHTQSDSDLDTLRADPAWAPLIERMRANAAALRPEPSQPFAVLPAVREVDGAMSPPGRLAMVLAVTTGRGLAIDAAVEQLRISVAADGTKPAGTVWYMASKDDARTGPRMWAFQAAAAALRAAGVQAEVREDILPPRGAEVIGAMIGASDFDWPGCGARILPGAWCDHLTSWSGAMQPGGGQTAITVYLRAGAAGAGGAVHEPFNIPLKFPSAFMHLHRVRGLSLAEAISYTMPMPFQYLAVGDPLSRPWSPRPVLAVPSAVPGAAMQLPPTAVWGEQVAFTITAPASTPATAALVVAHLGRVLTRLPPGVRSGTLDTRQLGFGANDVILGLANADQRIAELARATIAIAQPAALPALPDPGADAARWRFTEIFWPPPPAFYPGTTAAAHVDEAWLQVSEGGLHQLQWSSSRLLAYSWDGGRERVAGDGPDSDAVVLMPGWHRLRVHFAAGSERCELRFGRHGTMPLETTAWAQAQAAPATP